MSAYNTRCGNDSNYHTRRIVFRVQAFISCDLYLVIDLLKSGSICPYQKQITRCWQDLLTGRKKSFLNRGLTGEFTLGHFNDSAISLNIFMSRYPMMWTLYRSANLIQSSATTINRPWIHYVRSKEMNTQPQLTLSIFKVNTKLRSFQKI